MLFTALVLGALWICVWRSFATGDSEHGVLPASSRAHAEDLPIDRQPQPRHRDALSPAEYERHMHLAGARTAMLRAVTHDWPRALAQLSPVPFAELEATSVDGVKRRDVGGSAAAKQFAQREVCVRPGLPRTTAQRMWRSSRDAASFTTVAMWNGSAWFWDAIGASRTPANEEQTDSGATTTLAVATAFPTPNRW